MTKHASYIPGCGGFVRVGEVLPDVLKEIACRFELRQRLEAERDGPIADQDFVRIAERTGIKI